MSTSASFLPLQEEIPTPVKPSASSSEMRVPGWLKVVCMMLSVGVIINMVLMSMVLFELRHGRQSVDQAHQSVSKLQAQGAKLFTLADEADRFLHGSVPDLLLDVIQSDWAGLGAQVQATAFAVQSSAQKAGYSDIAHYSSLVASVGAVVSQYNPQFIVPPPQPSDDAGFLNTLSYLESWINQQLDATRWGWVASNCTTALNAALSVDWEAEYSWYDSNSGYESGHWSANSARSTVNSVLKYCQALQTLNGPAPKTEGINHKIIKAPLTKLKLAN